MPKPMTSETDASTGETIIRELTDDEMAQREADLKEIKQRAADELKQKSDDAKAKQIILDRLGITSDEAALLLK